MNNVVSQLPLAHLLGATARAVAEVARGRSLSDIIPAVEASARPGVQALTFHVMRHWGLARALDSALVPRAPAPPVRALLQTALAVLQPGTGGEPLYPAHTLVSQAVEAAKQQRATRAAVGLINACLRRFLAQRDALLAVARQDPQARWNHPLWWIERLRRDHPDHWETLLAEANRPAPMVLRVNRRRTDPAAYQALLAQAGLAAQAWGRDGLLLAQPVRVERLPGFADGLCSVQDGSAQLAADLLLAGRHWTPTDRVLDACAAPGGKTAHLLERSEADLWALEMDAARAPRINQTLERLGLRAQVRVADAGDPRAWWDGVPFDAILLDAPCSASGIVRRHPDVRWLRRPGDIAALQAQQQRLLEALWPLLAPGGRLVYATCSVFRAEGEEQVQAFLKRHTDARRQPAWGHLLPGIGPVGVPIDDNAGSGYDGFYYARVDKTPA